MGESSTAISAYTSIGTYIYNSIDLTHRYVESFNPFPHNDLLTPLGNKPFENTVGKGEIARNPQCFLPV